MIKVGTMRFCIVCKKYTYKFPIFLRGIKANKNEYKNYLNNKKVVAYTEKHWWGLKQETLTDLKVFDLNVTKEELNSDYRYLFDYKLHNRIQIGKDTYGNWKFYDYEDIKFYRKENNYDKCF